MGLCRFWPTPLYLSQIKAHNSKFAFFRFVPGEARKGEKPRKGALTGDMSPIHASSSKNKVADYGTTRVP